MYLSKAFSLIVLLLPSLALALASDRDKPIKVDAKTASIDYRKGVSVYRGDVVITQGSTLLKGDVVTIYNDQNRNVTKVEAQGKRAYFEELQDTTKGKKANKIEAWGETITYDIAGDRVKLLTDGELSQDGDVFKGEQINYNLKLQTVNATGKSQNGGEKGRIEMVIQPRAETGV
ncbi:lipopolysaccharide transport periplasmic protein LptA [Candidatus Sororendozoicomonas aggregata]|uniref:lipopolysaccharide transport periplasmic protein LptA n=1 Tax=Candidatus Sororendozoicomonas aggregata TaxID=3073239 RepID=UPI002ECFB4B3